jgi:predicted  nucleic acid-binding Zn-ribbon protein
LKEKLVLLIELQKMESATAKISTQKRNLPDLITALDAEFQAACVVLEKEREELEALRKHKREKDSLMQKGQETLRRSKERLSEVKTNKEYQSILKEIETIEAKNSQMEDETISLLDELDGREKAMKARQEELEGQRRRYEEEKAKMAEELNSLAAELEESQKKSDALKQQIPADMLRKYEQIIKAGRGVAVVPVWKEVCDGCHMSIPPQLYNELQKFKSLVTCPNCSRIMYWENRNG